MKKSTILIVDDEPDLARAYSRMLSSAGYETLQAATGAECLRVVGESRPDLILLDVMLPDMSGIEVCKRIKSDPALTGIYVINISGMKISLEDEAVGLDAGADGYLNKPVQERTLLAHVKALLRIKSTEEELRQTATELREINRRLEEYSRLKAEFVANVSHELRTPLTAIIGFANLIQISAKTEPIPARCADAFERILRNGRHLLALIDDVLDVSKIEAGRMVVHREHFDLADSVQAAFGELQSLAQQKELRYSLRVEEDFPLAFTDPLRVRQVLINLLSNAIKFTSRGSVEAELLRDGEDNFLFTVRDTGVGIDENSLEFIFERFRQVDGSMTRAAGGAGLGLSIVRQIVRLLGGKIEVNSEPGVGSEFRVTIPLVAPDQGHIASSPMPGIASPVSLPLAVASPAMEDDAADGDRPLVLIVEDEVDMASLLAETISRAGYRVRVAADGVSGLALARELEPAAVLLDVMMPGMDGWRVLRALKAEKRTAEIPIIVCSIVDNRPLGYRLGASDYLIKPVDPEQLLETLKGAGSGGVRTGEGYVLVVDDEHGIRELLSTALRSAGFSVRSAASGETALKIVAQATPRAVLCDLMMPGGMTGFEFIARMRAEAATAQTPIIVITGKEMMMEDRSLIAGQIADVIRKGDLMMSDIEPRLRETLEGLGVKPQNGEDSAR